VWPCVGLTDDILTTGLGSVVIFYSVCMIESCFSCSHVAITKLLTAPISALVLTFLTVCESRRSNPLQAVVYVMTATLLHTAADTVYTP